MLDKRFKLFVDFDGTITKKDIGAEIFLHYSDLDTIKKIISQINSHEITASDGWYALFSHLPKISEKELEKFILSFEIDKTFFQLIDFCELYNFEIFIVSDGFDFYIERILERENLSRLNFFSNKLEIDENKNAKIFFPFSDEECIMCSNCKRNHVIDNSSDDEFTIYIGNGNSDKCPAQFCDFIFAKDSLLKFCERERISFSPYNNFNDVIQKLEMLIKRKRLKKRHQAQLKRKSVYMLG